MRFPVFLRIIFSFLLPAAASCAQAAESYRVVHAYPHDEHAFTQGLVYADGHLYESTGIRGQSSLREEDLGTGRILRMQLVPDKYFAEGLTDWKNTLVQLTWQSHIGFVYDRATFKLLRTFHYDGEGWGLTHDAKDLILSDGTATVTDHGKPVKQLNELEYIHGEIYANVWYSDRIARISPASGRVLGWINLKGIMPKDQLSSDQAVLNGIAYDAAHDRLFVTGKLWPKIFEIQVVPEKAKLVPVHHTK